jgi:PIN domain nuclease of toxin-antitoxin system
MTAPRRVMLDTHVFLWIHAAPHRLGPKTVGLIEDGDNELLLSAASAWEIAIKHALGRLVLPVHPSRYVPERMRSGGIVALAITHTHALEVAELPPHHRDPFDRLLVAQATLERVPILSVDPQLSPYDIDVLDARV